ncbi:MAG: N-acetylglucosamine kinase [Cyanobium sp. NAT70]|nr:N-acetylglucosamine kinase [Cyanobium sp. NAT70]|tara:strand:+ start:3346 stop:4299 length:954 start_codon:yes stop_codon:yes gene_type:complete
MLLAGFDGGQTSTSCRIGRWEQGQWHTLTTGEGAGLCHLNAANGEQRFRQAIQSSITNAWANHDGDEQHLSAAVIGASGIEQGTPLQDKGSTLLAKTLNLPRERVLATGDERTALRGAFPHTAGIVVISGTGMICIGRDETGREHRCGGWGWLLDGAGSAFDLGHQGLQLSLRMADGRLPDHPLRQQIWQHLNCHSSAEIKARVVQADFGSAECAALAPLVALAAETGLDQAQMILNSSAKALSQAIQAIAHRLDLSRPRVVAHGGALKHLAAFRSALDAAVQRDLPELIWCKPAGDACDGALELALELVTGDLKPH